MIDPGKVCLFIPPGLKDFKLALFERIGRHIEQLGGRVARHDPLLLAKLPDEIIPIVGCSPQLTALIYGWRQRKRNFIYWDRGYARRVFATWLDKGDHGGYYRWHLNSFQMQKIRDVPDDRWKQLKIPLTEWRMKGRHIVVAIPSKTYAKFHGIEGWTDRVLYQLALTGTKRQIVVRDKESKRPLQEDLNGAHCLITHGSNTAVEALILGCPVIVDPISAAALISRTEIEKVEYPIPVMPDRSKWVRSLAYSQFNEKELCDGTLWKLMA